MRKVGIIHTTPATIASLGAMVKETISGVEVVNLLDDSILDDMRTRHRVDFVRERWIAYATTLKNLGVDAVLSACSTVGEIAEEADRILEIPVYRIDEAMAEEAVHRGGKITVMATLHSTLEPTICLVQRKAVKEGKQIELETVLVEGAYEALMAGNKKVHDEKIAKAVKQRLHETNVFVLAQASMASALAELPEAKGKVLTSPVLGIEKLKKDLERLSLLNVRVV